MRKTSVVIASVIVATSAMAHDFWVQPLRFTLAAPGSVPMRIYVGHGSARDRWGLAADHVVLFSSVGPDGIVDRKASLRLGAPAIDAIVPLARARTAVRQPTPCLDREERWFVANGWAASRGPVTLLCVRSHDKRSLRSGRPPGTLGD